MASLRSIRHLKQQLERFEKWGIACKTMSATCPSVILLRFLCFCSFFRFVTLLFHFIFHFLFPCFFSFFSFLFSSDLFSSLLFLIFRLVLEIAPLGTPDAPSQRVSWQRFSGAVAKACALKHRLLLFRVSRILTEQGPRPPLGSQFKSHSPLARISRPPCLTASTTSSIS